MTEEELNNLGQMIQHCAPADTGWILVAVPAHRCEKAACPVQAVSNLVCAQQMAGVLDGAAQMFEDGTHDPMFARAVERTQ